MVSICCSATTHSLLEVDRSLFVIGSQKARKITITHCTISTGTHLSLNKVSVKLVDSIDVFKCLWIKPELSAWQHFFFILILCEHLNSKSKKIGGQQIHPRQTAYYSGSDSSRDCCLISTWKCTPQVQKKKEFLNTGTANSHNTTSSSNKKHWQGTVKRWNMNLLSCCDFYRLKAVCTFITSFPFQLFPEFRCQEWVRETWRERGSQKERALAQGHHLACAVRIYTFMVPPPIFLCPLDWGHFCCVVGLTLQCTVLVHLHVLWALRATTARAPRKLSYNGGFHMLGKPNKYLE